MGKQPGEEAAAKSRPIGRKRQSQRQIWRRRLWRAPNSAPCRAKDGAAKLASASRMSLLKKAPDKKASVSRLSGVRTLRGDQLGFMSRVYSQVARQSDCSKRATRSSQ